MQQQSYFELRGAEIIEDLSLGGFVEFKCRLGFDDKFLIHDHIDSLNPEDISFVGHVNLDLSGDSMTAREELAF